MIKRLLINDYRLIKEANITLGEGLNIITGETGSGKSMLVGALSVLLGARASSDVVRKGFPKAVVQAEFGLNSRKMSELEIEQSPLTITREISREGKSRSVVNGGSVPVSTVKNIGKQLIDLHGQHEHQSLLDPKRHVEFVDAAGELSQLSGEVKELYSKTKTAKETLANLLEKKRLADEKKELLKFRMEELSSVDPQKGETAKLEEEISRLENGETLVNKSRELADILYERDSSLYEQLESARKELDDIAKIDEDLKPNVVELQGASIVLRELAGILSDYSSKVDLDPEHLEQLRERHTLLLSLTRKYGGSEEAMLQKYEETKEEFESHESADIDIREAEKRFDDLKDKLSSRCVQLSQKRTGSSQKLSTDIVNSMKGLGIEHSRFEVVNTPVEIRDGWVTDGEKNFIATENGIDVLEFYISTNPGEDMKPLSKVASGGEISRIMLAIKAILAGKDNIPVLVFDEIDIGISGRIAEAVGQRLHELSKHHQILCITHLPQIASKADNHLLVKKRVIDGRTESTVQTLNDIERREAVAALLAGSEVTDAARKQAEEMIN